MVSVILFCLCRISETEVEPLKRELEELETQIHDQVMKNYCLLVLLWTQACRRTDV